MAFTLSRRHPARPGPFFSRDRLMARLAGVFRRRTALADLDDRMLRDIGLTRDQVRRDRIGVAWDAGRRDQGQPLV